METNFNGVRYELELARFGDLKEEEEFIMTGFYHGINMNKKAGSKVYITPTKLYIEASPDAIVVVKRVKK